MNQQPKIVMKPIGRLTILLAITLCLGACGTVTDFVKSNLPDSHTGRPSVVVRLRQQRAFLFKGNALVADAAISTGREGYATPLGNFRVIRKDHDHRSGLYGDYVDSNNRIVKANVDVRKDRRPRGSHYLGTPMPYFVEFTPGFGLHAGNLPGYPASHGCVRLSYWNARRFFNAVRIGTRVSIRR